jgi:hypothetical protein
VKSIAIKRTLLLAAIAILLLASVSVFAATAQAQTPPQGVDTAERDDVVREDEEDGGATDDAQDGTPPAGVDTAERDDVVPEGKEDGGAADDAQDVTPPAGVDTAQRDDVVPEDNGRAPRAADLAPAPTGLRATTYTDSSVSLSWKAVTDAGAYKVEYRKSGSSTWRHARYVYSGTSYKMSSLSCNTTYQFQVRARSDGKTYSTKYGAPSTSASKKTALCIASVPTSLKSTASTDASVSLSWKAVSNAAAYKVEYRKSGSTSWLHASYVYSGTSDTVDRLVCDATYEFQVRARGNGRTYSFKYSAPSTSVSKKPGPCIPSAPTGVSATASGPTSVKVGWSPVSGIANYRVERRTGTSGSWSTVSSSATGSGYTVSGLLPGTAYYFRVSAYGDGKAYAAKWGGTSIAKSAKTHLPKPPTGLGVSVHSIDDDRLVVAFTRSESPHYYEFELHRSTSKLGTYSRTATANGSTSPVEFDGQTAGYWYKAQGRNCGTSSRSHCGSWSTWSNAFELASNNAPRFGSSSYSFSVAESAASGATVGRVSATDADGDRVSYSITSGNSGGKFAISSGRITVASALDHERTSSYSLTVQASDGKGGTATATVSISVTDVNEKPAFGSSSFSFSVAESTASGTTVGTVSATDPEGDTVSYSITGGNSGSKFTINARSGKITLASGLDFELSANYELTVKVADSRDSSKFDLGTVAIFVSNVNESLAFDLNRYQFAIPIQPSAPKGNLLVGAVRAYDPDADDVVEYSITGGNVQSSTCPKRSLFSIDSVGRIWACPSALPSSPTDYSLHIRASDGNGHIASTKVTVKASDLPVVSLRLDYDRVAEGDPINAKLSVSNPGSSPSELNLRLRSPIRTSATAGAADSAGASGRTDGAVSDDEEPGSSGAAGVAALSVTLPGAIGFHLNKDFKLSYPSSATKPQNLKIVTTGVGTSDLSMVYVTLSPPSGASSQVVVSNSVVPIVVYDKDIAIGGSHKGEWGFTPSNKHGTEPNHRRFSFNVPNAKKVQIDLTSGDRDPVLVLRDSNGNAVEWNDDGGAGLNAKIVRNLAPGDYTIEAFTQWPGGKGVFELRVSDSDEPLTDHDNDRADIIDAPFHGPQSGTTFEQHDIAASTWKNGTCTGGITSARQGDIVCVEVTGTGFKKGDSAVAVLFVNANHQVIPEPVGAIGLEYLNSTTMRGKWFAQHLSKYANLGDGSTTYRLAVIGHETSYSGAATPTLKVLPFKGSPQARAGRQVGCPILPSTYRDVECLLAVYGLSDVEDRLETVWAVAGESLGYQSDEEMAVDFLKGAILGEGGINDGRKPGYYAGWIIFGFIPIVDIATDIRDFAFVSTECPSLWRSFISRSAAKCNFLDVPVELAIDGFSIVPGIGKFGDGAQVAKIIGRAKANKAFSKEAIDVLKSGPYIGKWIATGRIEPWKLPSQLFRGHLLQDLRLRGYVRSLEHALYSVHEQESIPQRSDGRTMGGPRSAAPTSQARRPAPHSGAARGDERHPVRSAQWMHMASHAP